MTNNRLLTEIHTAMEGAVRAHKNWFFRALHLRQNEAELAKFTSRFDAAAEAFTVRRR
jgi:hypothetical protein